MDDPNKLLSWLKELPLLLNEYAGYSYPLLGLLIAGAILILTIHYVRRVRTGEGLSGAWVFAGVVLGFVAVGGFILKYYGEQQIRAELAQFLADHRVRDGEPPHVMVFDFKFPDSADGASGDLRGARMDQFVSVVARQLFEDLPEGFRQPRVVRIPTSKSPWRDGLSQVNFEEALTELNALEVVWGSVLADGDKAEAFLGLSDAANPDLDRIIPLSTWPLAEDPFRENEFGKGRYRILGLVTLGMALETYRRAEEATGEDRRRLFLEARAQLLDVRRCVNNLRDDPTLKRTVYSASVTQMIDNALAESEVLP
jgi:hypothetical protein